MQRFHPFTSTVVLSLMIGACGRSTPPSAPDAAAPPAPPASLTDDVTSVSAADTAAPPPAPAPPAALTPPELRLPRDVVPTRQAITLRIAPSRSTLTGTTTISLELAKATDHVWLHRHELAIGKASLEVDGAARPVETIAGDQHHVAFRWSEPLPAGTRATLSIDFTAEISDTDYHGVFRQKDEAERFYVYTQLESIHAREVFPCFDSPTFKLPYQVTLEVPKDQLAFSNTPAIDEQIVGDEKRITFAETPPLPSYLIAVSVGPFQVIDIGVGGRAKVPMRVVMPQGDEAKTRFVKENMDIILRRLEDYFDAPYPYAKLDTVVIPHFLGAMEHPGHITYDQRIVLRDPDTEGVAWKQIASSIIAHELAHQWFGNLVTLAWWDDLWLNEAFANWLASKVVAAWQPSWQVDAIEVNAVEEAMSADQLPSAHQIRKAAKRVDDLFAMFDAITYDKGAAVIGMFERHVGEDAFREGMRRYVAEHAHKTATSADFLAAIAAAARDDSFAPAFETFLEQPGLPLVALALSCDGAPVVTVEQSRYVPAGAVIEGTPLWQIPICIRYDDGDEEPSRQCALMRERTLTMKLEGAGEACPRWVFANAGGRGYHRSEYRGELLAGLLGATAHLTSAERIALLNDLGAAVGAGRIPIGDVFGLLPKLVQDDSWFVVKSAVGIAAEARDMVPAALGPNYGRFLAKVFGAHARELGWEHRPRDDDDTRLLRESLVPSVALRGRDPALLKQALALAEKLLDDPDAVDPSMRGEVLAAAALAGDKALFDKYLAAAKASSDAAVRRHFIGALGWFDQALVLEALGLMLDGTLRIEDALGILRGALGRRETREAVYRELQKGFEKLEKIVPRMMLPYMMRMALPFCDAEHRDDMVAFFTPKLDALPGGQKMMTEVREAMDVCIAQRKLHGPGIEAFLQAY